MKSWSWNTRFLGLILAISVFIGTAYAIRCYQCKSQQDEGCEEVTQKYLLNCTDEKHKYCRKIEQWVDFEVNKMAPHNKRVIRQCAEEADPERPCYYRAGFGGRVNVCHCFTEGCNAAPISVKASSLLVGLVLFTAVYKALI